MVDGGAAFAAPPPLSSEAKYIKKLEKTMARVALVTGGMGGLG